MIASELMEGGELKVPEEGFPLSKAMEVLKSVLKCYSVLYRKGLAHRDLKPQNILTTKEGEMKISDFGSAKEQDGKK